MVKRFNDVPYGAFSFWSDMTVVCPKCGEAGTVHYDKERKTAVFNCGGCFWKNEALPCGDCGFDVTAQCTSTGKYFRTSVPDGKIHGQKIKVRGKTVWALNREHLQYLIDYLSADIRAFQPEDCNSMRSQSDTLPALMKSTKNREGIVKLLTKLCDSR